MQVALIGNQNCGKTSLYNRLTNSKNHIGNFAGVTVELTSGKADKSTVVIDLPGVYSLCSYTSEEKITNEFVKAKEYDVLLNIIDGTNFVRNLYLTLQLVSLQKPMVIAINMIDEVQKNGSEIDYKFLENYFGIPIIPISASKNIGINRLKQALKNAKIPKKIEIFSLDYEVVATMRYQIIDNIAKSALTQKPNKALEFSQKLDKLLTHRIWGLPIFFCFLSLIFYLSFGVFGNLLSYYFDMFLDFTLSEARIGMQAISLSPNLEALIADGILSGIFSVLSFLPTIVSLFFFLSLLEDSGYLARVVFITDKLLSEIGLSGRSIVPLLLGFGCSVPAIMSTRTIKNQKEKDMAITLIPFCNCSAKLPVFSIFTVAFFSNYQVFVMLSLYIISILIGIFYALLIKKLSKTKGMETQYILELPPYRFPTIESTFVYLFDKAKAFTSKSFTIIFLVSFLVWVLSTYNFSMQTVTDDSMLMQIAKFFSPIFTFHKLNDWRITAALLVGITAKESILSTFAILLSSAKLQTSLLAIFTPQTAFVFLVFVALYMPCMATFAAIRQEKNTLFACKLMLIQTLIAYTVSLVFAVF